ncbi:unnamed protein product [Angiostrongylus costaricensis]|uniref:Uncharacterized protein n=1 Tax=Angiostrongylus costaricensis TaxID=334426 RepID=A0A0R3PIM8_ANGCS|nr:unnamed protein product [Angiostrongylus costaricensis]
MIRNVLFQQCCKRFQQADSASLLFLIQAFGRVIAPRSISTNVPGSVGDFTNGVRNASNSSCSSSWQSHQHSFTNSHHIAAVSALAHESGTALLKRRTAAICSDIIPLSDDEPDPSDAKRPPMPVPSAVVEHQPASRSDLGCEAYSHSIVLV